MKRDLWFLLLCIAILPLFFLAALALWPEASASSTTVDAKYMMNLTSLSTKEQIVLVCAPVQPTSKRTYK